MITEELKKAKSYTILARICSVLEIEQPSFEEFQILVQKQIDKGLNKYGYTIDTTPLVRDWKAEAWEEIIDAIVYSLKQKQK